MAADPLSAGMDVGGSLLGGIIGLIQAQQARQAANDAIARSVQGYGDIPLPVLQQMQAQQLGPSAQQNVYADPALVQDQQEGISSLGRIADSGGMTLEDRANNEALQRDAAQRAMAQRRSILSMLSRSGVNPGATSVAMQLGAARDQAETAANAGLQTAGNAQRRALQAIMQRSQLAGTQRNQGFNEASDRARAADIISQYNANARTKTNQYNAALPQQNFENAMTRQAGISGASQNAANFYTGDANRTQQTFANLGTGAGQALGGLVPKAQPQPQTTYDYPGYSQAPRPLDENS
jgi:hypothetical protein